MEIHVSALGRIPWVAQELAAHLSRHIHAPCRVLPPADTPLPMLAGRDQVDADALLGLLESGRSAADSVLVGVTDRDVAVPIFTFVFGRARQGGRAAVVSTSRLDPAFYGLPPDPDQALRRTIREVLHELGHIAGLHHCKDFGCLMHFAASVDAVDVRGSEYCEDCAGRLPPWLRTPGVARPLLT